MISNSRKFDIYSNSFLPHLLETIDGFFIVIHPKEEFKIEFVSNNKLLEEFGQSKDNLLGKSFLSLIHSNDIEKAKDFLINNVSSNIGMTELRFLTLGAKEKWFKISKKEVKQECFENKMMVYITDISKQKELELQQGEMSNDIALLKLTMQEVKNSEEKYRDLAEFSPDIIFETDKKLNLTYVNAVAFEKFGYTQKEVKEGLNIAQLIDLEDRQIAFSNVKTIFEGKKTDPNIYRLRKKDGTSFYARIHSRPVIDNGQVIGIRGTVTDINNLMIAEQKLKESEQKYRLLSENTDDLIVVYDENLGVEYSNEATHEKILGYPFKQLKNLEFRISLMHRDDSNLVRNAFQEGFRTGKFKNQVRIKHKDGHYLWFETKGRTFTDKEEKIKMLAVSRDITELKTSEEKYRSLFENNEIIGIRVWLDDITEKKMYEELIYELNINFLNFTADIRNNIELLLNTGLKLLNGDLILYAHKSNAEGEDKYQIITSENETYLFDSKEFNEQIFLSELLIEGHDFPQTFPDIDRNRFSETDPIIKKINARGAFGKAFKSQEGLDNLVCVYYKENPQISGQDKLVLLLICDAIEIEQRRWQVQQDLEKQNLTLDKINKLKTELFSRTSHELKTPLISIKGFTELLLTLHKSKLDTETISILEEIKDGSKRLEKIVNLLLESTKLEAGQLDLNKAKEDLTFLINFCVKELKGLARLRNQTIVFDAEDKIEAFFDKERIYEVISNLLLNAVKYTSPGGTISIQTQIKNDSYIVSVKDNGIGFIEEEKSQVFKQFGKIERYEQGWDVAIEGTGLGLYITKKLVELHDGKIWLESEGRNKGTTFFFSIPKL